MAQPQLTSRPAAPAAAPSPETGVVLPLAVARALLAAAALAAIVAGTLGEWEYTTAAIVAGVFAAVAGREDVRLAGAIALTAALPVCAASWLASYGPGLGLFTLLLGLLVAVLVPVAVRSRERLLALARDVARQPLVWALAAFAALGVLSLVTAPRGPASVQIAREYVGQALAFPVLMTLVLVSMGRDRTFRAVRLVVVALVVVAVAGCLLAVVQMATDAGYPAPHGELDAFVEERATGLAEHPGTWAAFSLMALALAAFAWTREGGRLLGAAVVVLAGGIILTGSRASWIAVAFVGLAVLAGAGAAVRRRLVVVALIGAGFVLALATWNLDDGVDAIGDLLSSGPAEQRGGGGPKGGGEPDVPVGGPAVGADRVQVDESAKSRIVLTRVELDLGLREPLTGVGLGNIGPAMIEHDLSYVVGKERTEVGFTPGEPVDKHNTYAGLFAELGVPGIGLFLAILGSGVALLLGLRRRLEEPRHRALAEGLLAALGTMLIYGLFTDADHLPFLWWMLALALALGVATGVRGRAAQGTA